MAGILLKSKIWRLHSKNARAFNQDLDEWDTSNVFTMEAMFINATSFNGEISTWDVRKYSIWGPCSTAAQKMEEVSGRGTSPLTTTKYQPTTESWEGSERKRVSAEPEPTVQDDRQPRIDASIRTHRWTGVGEARRVHRARGASCIDPSTGRKHVWTWRNGALRLGNGNVP